MWIIIAPFIRDTGTAAATASPLNDGLSFCLLWFKAKTRPCIWGRHDKQRNITQACRINQSISAALVWRVGETVFWNLEKFPKVILILDAGLVQSPSSMNWLDSQLMSTSVLPQKYRQSYIMIAQVKSKRWELKRKEKVYMKRQMMSSGSNPNGATPLVSLFPVNAFPGLYSISWVSKVPEGMLAGTSLLFPSINLLWMSFLIFWFSEILILLRRGVHQGYTRAKLLGICKGWYWFRSFAPKWRGHPTRGNEEGNCRCQIARLDLRDCLSSRRVKLFCTSLSRMDCPSGQWRYAFLAYSGKDN